MHKPGLTLAFAFLCAGTVSLTVWPAAALADVLPPATGGDHAAAVQANARGQKALDQKNLTVALKEFESAVRLDASLAAAYVNLGWARYLTRDPSLLAKAEMDEHNGFSLAQEPNLKAAAAYNLGRILERKGDLDGAAAQYRESLKARPGSKAAQEALDRAEGLGPFAALAGIDPNDKGAEVSFVGPVTFAPRAGAPGYRGGVIVRHPQDTEEESKWEYTVVVADEAGKLAGKLALPVSTIDKDTEHGSATAQVKALALPSGSTLLQVDKVETRADQGTGKWPDGHYDYLTLFTVENGQIHKLLSRPLRVERSMVPEGEVKAYKITMKVAGADLVFDEAEVRAKGKPAARQTVTYKLKNGAYQADKKSIVPGDDG